MSADIVYFPRSEIKLNGYIASPEMLVISRTIHHRQPRKTWVQSLLPVAVSMSIAFLLGASFVKWGWL